MLEPETAAEVLIKAGRGRGDKPDYHDSGLLAGQTSGPVPSPSTKKAFR